MQGAFSNRRGAALYLLVWLILGTVLGGVIVSAFGAGWSNALLFALPATLVYAFAAGFSSHALCRAFPLTERRPSTVVAVLSLAALMSALLWTLLCRAWNALWLVLGVDWAGIALSVSLTELIFGLGVLLYGLSVVLQYLRIEFERARSAERRVLESKVMAQEAELRMLRTQIDPHFLFNSLNSISALTSQNPAGAREMTVQLAEFFRHSLGLEAHKKVTLQAETVLTAHFLAVEKIRFGARLMVEQDIADDARRCLVPPMIIQPLVENAVKHGIGNLTEGGTIRIRARRDGSLLRISVDNDIDDDLPAPRSNGIGLANVRQRLAAAYGHEASINWTRQGRTFTVELTLPAETTEP